jgi:hypothetical protein
MFPCARRAAIIAVALAAFSFVPAQAKSVQDYEAMPSADQSDYMTTFLEKMTSDIGRQNPELAAHIKEFFVRKQPGKPLSEGVERVTVELMALDRKAQKGEVDLSKIQVEAVVVYVTKQQFPPPPKS